VTGRHQGFKPPARTTPPPLIEQGGAPTTPEGRAHTIPLHIITGPPAAGTSTYIRDHRQPGDITIDYDEIANTIAGETVDNHTHTDTVKAVTQAARRAAITEAVKHANTTDVWIVDSTPSAKTLDKYRQAGAEIRTIDPGKAVVMRRCKAERPPHMLKVAAAWYDRDKPKTAAQRGYDHRHQQVRKRLMFNMKDGTPCEWCQRPMWKDPAKNFDGAALEADHTRDLKHHGPGDADRLLHRACNRSRGAGHDERQPGNEQVAESNEPDGFTWG
jgi:hypothetical protein